MPELSGVLAALQIPPEYSRYESIIDSDVIERLRRWKQDVLRTLIELETRLQQMNLEHASLSLKEQGDIVSAASVFDGEGDWTASDSRKVACDIVHRFSEPPLSLVVQILQHNLKPIFQSNPHPSLSLETGRKLARPAGGPSASQDFYDTQTWKDYPGVSNTVLWCVRNLPTSAYEELWPFVIPPIMALLDDYEARYKLLGVNITSVMLERVPSSLLKRTGVDSLLMASLSRSLTQLQSPETPFLLPAAISTTLTLIQLTTVAGSENRFNQLCGLLGDGIIGSIWPYSSDRLEALLASVDALPQVFQSLGIGCARYLKVLITQLVHPLAPLKHEKTSVALQMSSLRALSAVIKACPERIPQWKGTIINGVARCWVGVIDSESTVDDDLNSGDGLKRELKNVSGQLAIVCPSVLQEEYPRFIAADAKIFKDLFGSTN
ncbi:hypothetical protein GGX14DRAFT_649117 [Mycena pura]|uniref:Uncharacterized protein n=1 Tax=Mycena pura TaxID=153505 RepID=A0AAD7E1Z7_9AGAR|nr:hypothetical protein GGX14DRAFT_649117 [Mycena pura]